MSDWAAASLYNTALKTVDAITDDNTKLVVDQAKIRRSRDIFSAKQKNIRMEMLQKEELSVLVLMEKETRRQGCQKLKSSMGNQKKCLE